MIDEVLPEVDSIEQRIVEMVPCLRCESGKPQQIISDIVQASEAIDAEILDGRDNPGSLGMRSSVFPESPPAGEGEMEISDGHVAMTLKLTGKNWAAGLYVRSGDAWEEMSSCKFEREGTKAKSYDGFIRAVNGFVDEFSDIVPGDQTFRINSLSISFGFPQENIAVNDGEGLCGIDAVVPDGASTKAFDFRGATGKGLVGDILRENVWLCEMIGSELGTMCVANDTVIIMFDRDVTAERVQNSLRDNGFLKLLSQFEDLPQSEEEIICAPTLAAILGTGFNYSEVVGGRIVNREVGNADVLADGITKAMIAMSGELPQDLVLKTNKSEYQISGDYLVPSLAALMDVLGSRGEFGDESAKFRRILLRYIHASNNSALLSNLVGPGCEMAAIEGMLNGALSSDVDGRGGFDGGAGDDCGVHSHGRDVVSLSDEEFYLLRAGARQIMKRATYAASTVLAAGFTKVGLKGKNAVIPVEGTVFWEAVVDKDGTKFGEAVFLQISEWLDSKLFPFRAKEMEATATAGARGGYLDVNSVG